MWGGLFSLLINWVFNVEPRISNRDDDDFHKAELIHFVWEACLKSLILNVLGVLSPAVKIVSLPPSPGLSPRFSDVLYM